MSNGGWQPPQSGETPPPPGVPAGASTGPFQPPSPGGGLPGQPTQPVALESSKQPPARSKGKVIAAAVGAVAIVGAGIFAVTRISGDSASGGAGSPEEAGQSLLDAIGNEDVLGAVDILLPGERETLRQPLTDFVDELRRLDVFSDDADLSDIGGLEIEVTDSAIDVEETNVDDIANLSISFDATAAVNGGDLPIGDLILDNADVDPNDLDVAEQNTNDSAELPLTVVREDGRWYVSLFYTVAEQARLSSGAGDVPELADAIAPTGGDSPEDAFDAFLGGLESLDVEAIIAALNPNEFEALQRYAPLFLDDAQRELDAAGVEISINEPEYTVSGDGDTRSMTVSYIAGEITAEGDTVGFSFEDGCFEITPPAGVEDEPINTCALTDDAPEIDEMFGEASPQVNDFIDTVAATFDDYEQPGFVVKRVDGEWFLSPMATGAEQLLAVMRALDRDEIEQLINDGAATFEDVFASPDFAIPNTDDFLDDPGAEPADPDVTMPDDIGTETIPDPDMPEDTSPAPSAPDGEGIVACYSAESVDEATQCYQDLLDAGEIDSFEFPAYLRLPECGLAELWFTGEYYILGDADFVAANEAAKPCFEAAVADGTIDEFEVPTEVSHPECLKGVNVYASEDDDVLSEFFDCALG